MLNHACPSLIICVNKLTANAPLAGVKRRCIVLLSTLLGKKLQKIDAAFSDFFRCPQRPFVETHLPRSQPLHDMNNLASIAFQARIQDFEMEGEMGVKIREIKYYFNIWGIRKKKKEGGTEKEGGGGENAPISPPLDPRLRLCLHWRPARRKPSTWEWTFVQTHRSSCMNSKQKKSKILACWP